MELYTPNQKENTQPKVFHASIYNFFRCVPKFPENSGYVSLDPESGGYSLDSVYRLIHLIKN